MEDFRGAMEFENDEWISDEELELNQKELTSLYPHFWRLFLEISPMKD